MMCFHNAHSALCGHLDQNLDVYLGFANEGTVFLISSLIPNVYIMTSSSFTIHITKYPQKVPALLKKCCCGRTKENEDDVPTIGDIPTDQGNPDYAGHTAVASGSVSSLHNPDAVTPEIPTHRPRMSTDFQHSMVFGKKVNDQEKPSDRLSYLADPRYCIHDVEPEEGGDGGDTIQCTGVELVVVNGQEMVMMIKPSGSPHAFVIDEETEVDEEAVTNS